MWKRRTTGAPRATSSFLSCVKRASTLVNYPHWSTSTYVISVPGYEGLASYSRSNARIKAEIARPQLTRTPTAKD